MLGSLGTLQYLKWATGKMGRDFFIRDYSDRIIHNNFKLKEGTFKIDINKKLFTQSDESLGHIAQTSCGCPVSVHGQLGWGFEQSGLMKCVPVQSRGLALDDF